MINRLIVKNSVAFENVDLEFKNGFNVFSGASGSGKSVLIESLLGAFGIKDSNADMIEANLDIALGEFGVDLNEFGLSEEDILVLSILKKDKTRYFLNRYNTSKKRLSELVSRFAKHISSKGADELKMENILRVFDDFIAQNNPNHKKLLSDFTIHYRDLLSIQEEYAALKEEEKNIQNLKEFAEFEIEKISSLNLVEGEYERLLELKKTLSKKEKIQESISGALEALDGISKISHTLALIGKDSLIFQEGILEARSIIDEERERLEELGSLDGEEMLNRISTLSDINRRYGGVSEALAHLETQKQKLQDYQNISFNKETLYKQIQSLQNTCLEIAKQISLCRNECVVQFEKEILRFCNQLLLKKPTISLKSCELYNLGLEKIELTLESSSIDVLSSGEYNRLRLVIMCIDALINGSKGILVLDEIDANLSGEESEGVAKMLKILSKTYQIFAISHQPHMPVLADSHYLVRKKDTKSEVILLDKEGRIKEMARMISGANITKEALEFAKKRLEESQ
ncbi:AAA family ATPase [Helicobacter cappadocius]|uniref:DNA repair protein RecN n=1 Tax=Helicobacter cappadocius TaxID=3063998 RepID=A0AA90TF36_9HELI|nr:MULTISPECIES: AAA family ATPase [unclassified Helicobacter]MDO7253345.1 AAA family ATPase [Helicobacter sp. faydin-H75]MDP2539225.1 AAA family ATPase [Helicobacter sp. faydin-H76]